MNELVDTIKRKNRQRDLLEYREVLNYLASIAKDEGLTAHQLLEYCFSETESNNKKLVEAEIMLKRLLNKHLLNTLNENIF